jgi:hypothetical protein
MVRLNRSAGKGLRRLEEQAGTRKTFWNRSPDVGKKVYMYVVQKFPGCHIDSTHTTSNAGIVQWDTIFSQSNEFN